MKVWYNCKVKYGRETEDGFMKQITEDYLVDAISYTEAESRIYGIMENHVSGEFSVNSISKTNITEVINYEDEESWYKCKVTYSTVDGDSGKDMKVTAYFLVSASHVKMAFERVEDNLSSMLVPFDIPAITLTKIIDVFPLEMDEERVEVSPEFDETSYATPVPPTARFEAEEEELVEEDNVATTPEATPVPPTARFEAEEEEEENTIETSAGDIQDETGHVTSEENDDQSDFEATLPASEGEEEE